MNVVGLTVEGCTTSLKVVMTEVTGTFVAPLVGLGTWYKRGRAAVVNDQS